MRARDDEIRRIEAAELRSAWTGEGPSPHNLSTQTSPRAPKVRGRIPRVGAAVVKRAGVLRLALRMTVVKFIGLRY